MLQYYVLALCASPSRSTADERFLFRPTDQPRGTQVLHAMPCACGATDLASLLRTPDPLIGHRAPITDSYSDPSRESGVAAAVLTVLNWKVVGSSSMACG
ncbi:UNVERIFIED_CONTAM: hypothetical protein Slati_4555400 [Sesamum latifolium]|uniref:Secreted protein n=1 Tax=Sesamum latifolium TaxID=2727402 RepID=A0AAW2S4F7_9LAMI